MFKRIKCVTVFILLISLFPAPDVHASDETNKAVLIIKSSPDSEMETRLTFINNKTFAGIARHRKRKQAEEIPVSDTYLILSGNGGAASTYVVDRNGSLIHEQTHEIIEVDKAAKTKLKEYADSLRSLHYGKLTSWERARSIIPRKKKFKVIDMETGLSFNVQRRAGRNHADVQPLTREDSAVMKQIYNGRWSWNRKAILVKTEDHLLAASMNGMPHGGDGIPGNGFSGHFCIFFLGSATHGSRKVDLEHQLMVHKAAGELDDYFNRASPYQIADTFFAAMNLKESEILKMSFTHANHEQLLYFLQERDSITGIRKRADFHQQEDDADLLTLDIPVDVSVVRDGQEERAEFIFKMARTSPADPWKIGHMDMK
ncbi:hypothetical protein [Paenibacillus alkalitolerans]|uniref:hypothetical protein n=1 Tax=Paenibacillus alkalitolerans TaxID=2799335 RepID=UPI0018F71A65|nr:hypothetical protein [Paenibacillus alkalitolerans]